MRPKNTDKKQAAFGQQIKAYRLAAELTQENLGELSGLEPSYISGVECGSRNLTFQNILILSKALNVRPSQLFAVFDSHFL